MSRNPFYIRSMIHTHRGIHLYLSSKWFGRNPFYIRSMIHTKRIKSLIVDFWTSQSLLHQVNHSHKRWKGYHYISGSRICRNPFYIRSIIHTENLRKAFNWLYVHKRRNPFYIRSIIHTENLESIMTVKVSKVAIPSTSGQSFTL